MRNAAVVSALGCLLYGYWSSSSSASSWASSVVAAGEDELLDLLSRTRLTSDDLIALYARCMRQHPTGLLSIEQFAVECEQQVSEARQRRRKDRQRRKDNQQRREAESSAQKQRVEQRLAARQQTGQSTEQDEHELAVLSSVVPDEDGDIGSYWDEQEEAEEKDGEELLAGGVADERREKQLKESVRRGSFSWWELLSLFRTAQPVTDRYHDIRELMVGVAQLAYDHEPWPTVNERRRQQQGQAQQQTEQSGGKQSSGSAMSRSRRLMLCYQPWKKLEVAWRVSQPPGKGDTMSYDEVRLLMERMLRSGHFTSASLVRGVSQSWLQPQHVQMDAEAVTYLIFQQLHSDSRWTGQPSRAHIEQDVFLLHDASLSAAAAPPPPPLSFEERLTASPAPHSSAFLRQFRPLAASTLLAPAYHGCSTSTPAIPASSSLTYSQLLSVCRSLSVRGQLQLWYGVARDAKSGERAGPIKRRRMALQEMLAHNANKLSTLHDTQRTADWLL